MGGGEDDFVIAPERRGRRWLIAAIAFAFALAFTGGVWGLTHRRAPSGGGNAIPPIEPAQVTTPAASPVATSTVSETETAEPSDATETAKPDTVAPAPATPATFIRAPYLVFRLKDTLYLARETGARAIPLVSTGGVYALSPDARSLAFVDSRSRRLSIVDLTKQTTMTITPARQVSPVWSPDSAWLIAVRDTSGGAGTEVVRVERATGQATALSPGSRGAISPDASLIGVVPAFGAGDSGVLRLLRAGRPFKDLKAPGPVMDAALGSNTAFVCTGRALQDPQAQGVWAIGFDGAARKVAGVQGSGFGDLGSLTLSPNGAYLAYALTGDDGYSRMAIVKTSGGAAVYVSSRRDFYPLYWASDSSAVFAIEGNSWQGETTALVRISPDGHRESVVVAGADR